MQHQVLPYIAPDIVFAQVANLSGAIFLDSSMSHDYYGRYSYILINPLTTIKAGVFVENTIFDHVLKDNQKVYDKSLPPFIGGWAGYFSYDLSKQFETIPTTLDNIVPDYILGLYNQVFAFDHITKKCYIIVIDINGYNTDVDGLITQLMNIYDAASSSSLKRQEIITGPVELSSNMDEVSYIEMVEKAQEYILNGDIFEVNCAQYYTAVINDDFNSSQVYLDLRKVNPAPFSAYLNLDTIKILSMSPERFFSVRDREIESRPIKGTIKRSIDRKQDEVLKHSLELSEKDRAENIMIVDLMRNDLNKICDPKTVRVSQLCKVESFTNLHHLVSVVNGRLKDSVSTLDIIPALFPAGSITGAPKIRAQQIIEELEQKRRGIYCGSIGYFSFNGCVDLSVAIRTLIIKDNELSLSVGGAITLDSNPREEYEESVLKGKKILDYFANR